MVILNKVYYLITYLVGSTFKEQGTNPNGVALYGNCSGVAVMRKEGTDHIL